MIEINELLSFANFFADKSRKILKKKFFEPLKIEEKEDGSLVTDIDKEIELMFKENLNSKFPSHNLIGEEFGFEKKESKYTWIIDPLDGTHNFIAGKPIFGTLISCMKNNKPILGVIDIPILEKRWCGGVNIGVKLNEEKCNKIHRRKKYNQLIVASTSLLMFDKEFEKKIKNIYHKVRFPVFGSDCFSYGLLLSGKVDLIIEANMKPWDYLAQVALIKEQGGVITDWEGKELNLESDGKVIASIEKNHHKKTLEYLNK
ncbi:MAG: inositol monophosphatase family protein [Alphaproteobacteria bacterium]